MSKCPKWVSQDWAVNEMECVGEVDLEEEAKKERRGLGFVTEAKLVQKRNGKRWNRVCSDLERLVRITLAQGPQDGPSEGYLKQASDVQGGKSDHRESARQTARAEKMKEDGKDWGKGGGEVWTQKNPVGQKRLSD